jgi:hypothetical protein
MNWVVAVVLQPFVALLLFVVAYYLARWVSGVLPDGPLRRLLLRPIGKGVRRWRSPRSRRPLE